MDCLIEILSSLKGVYMSKKPTAKTLKGTIVSFNISPKGVYEGVLVSNTDSEIVQVNFYPEFGAYIGDKLAINEDISWQVTLEEEEKEAVHPVYSLLRFKNAHGKEILLDEEPHDVTTKGTVAQINYALHGEPNGAILDNGDFIHLKPKGFKHAELEVGQKVTVKGELKPSFLEHRVIEVHAINGIEMKHGPKEKPKHKAA